MKAWLLHMLGWLCKKAEMSWVCDAYSRQKWGCFVRSLNGRKPRIRGKNRLNNYILVGRRFCSSCVWPCFRGYAHPDVSRVSIAPIFKGREVQRGRNTAKASKVALYCITEKSSKFSTGFNWLTVGYCKMVLWQQLLSLVSIVRNFFKIWLRVSSHETLCISSRQCMKLGIVYHSWGFFAIHKKPRQGAKKTFAGCLGILYNPCIVNFLGAISLLAYS